MLQGTYIARELIASLLKVPSLIHYNHSNWTIRLSDISASHVTHNESDASESIT